MNVATGDELIAGIGSHQVDVAIIDVQLTEGNEEGIEVARIVKRKHPSVAVLMLTAQTATAQAIELLSEFETGIGYLCKDELEIDDLVPQLSRLVAGGPVLGRSIANRLLRPTRRDTALTSLSRQETEVLRLMAQGLSNVGIARRLTLAERTIEDHVGRIFDKLGINVQADSGRSITNKRVLAVLTFLRMATSATRTQGN